MDCTGGTSDLTKIAIHTIFRICRYGVFFLIIPADHIEPARPITHFASRAFGIEFNKVHGFIVSPRYIVCPIPILAKRV
jgi:hypothetical protein